MTLNENLLDEPKKTLNKNIFIKDSNIMKTSVKTEILNTLYKWFKNNNLDQSSIKKVVLIGSSASYNYTENSDIDISVVTDLKTSWIKNNWKTLPNGNKLKDTKHEINYYLINDEYHKDDIEKSDSSYDIINGEWIKEPKKNNLKVPYSFILEVAKFFFMQFDINEAEFNRDVFEFETFQKLKSNDFDIDEKEIDERKENKLLEIKADFTALKFAHKMLKSFRKDAYENNETELFLDMKIKNVKESGNELLYKIFEKYGYDKKFSKIEQKYNEIIS